MNEIPDGPPIPMSDLTLGERYGSEDMYRDMGIVPGSRVAFEKDDVIYTDQVESVHYSSASPAIYRRLNRWQRAVRALTPRRWRKSLLVRPAEAPAVRINGDSPDVGKTLAQLEQMKSALNHLLRTP